MFTILLYQLFEICQIWLIPAKAGRYLQIPDINHNVTKLVQYWFSPFTFS